MKHLPKLIFFILLILLCCGFSQAKENATAYQKNIITLDFKKIPVRELLQFIAEAMGYNVIMSDSVKGTVSLHFRDITRGQALNIILEMTGFVKKEKSNVLFIATPGEFAERQKSLDEALPVKSVKVSLKHAEVNEVVGLLKSQVAFLSPLAKISVNPHGNSLWLQETADNMPILLHYLHDIDQPEKQIFIAAKIVNIDDKKTHELGIKFASACQSKSPDMHMSLPDQTPNRLQLAIASFAESQLIHLELDALEASGHSKLMADPKLITQNNKSALIQAGEEIPYQEKTSSGATSLAFRKAALSLKVTPICLPDGRIKMELEISQNKTSSISVNGNPAIQTQEIKTQVIVRDNETIILGGIFETSSTKVVDKLPLIGCLPVVGTLLQHKRTECTRKELLIFVSPQVLLGH